MGVDIASNTIPYAIIVLKKRDHVWFDVLSHFGGHAARAIVLAKMGGWYCDRKVIPVDYMVLDANEAYERTSKRAWIYQEQCIPALDIDILPEACYIHLAYVRCCLTVEVAEFDDSGDGMLEPTSKLPVEIRRFLRARFYRKNRSYLLTLTNLRQRAELAEALPGAVKRFEEGVISYESDRPVACFSVIFKLAGIEGLPFDERSVSIGINLACLKCTEMLIYSGSRPGVRNIGILSLDAGDGECALPIKARVAGASAWSQAAIANCIKFWALYYAIVLLIIPWLLMFMPLFGPLFLWDWMRGTFRCKFSAVRHPVGMSDVAALILLPAGWVLLLIGRAIIFLISAGKNATRPLCDEFCDVLHIRHAPTRSNAQQRAAAARRHRGAS